MGIFLLQQMPTVSLGPAGTVLISMVAAVLAIISWRQRTWKSAADAAVVEMKIHKAAAERLRAATQELTIRNAKLEAQTDLKPLVDAITSWVTEGRTRFDDARSRLDAMHTEQSNSLKGLLEELKAQRATSEDSYRSLTAAFMAHTLEDQQHQLENKQVTLRFVSMMDAVERRLSEVAVEVGISRWQNPPDVANGESAEPTRRRQKAV